MASLTIVAVLNTATGDLLPAAVARVEDRSRDGDLHRIEARVRSMLSDHRSSVVRIMMGGWASTAASGVLVDPRGLVLTAGHVIDPGNRRFDVELADGEVLGAKQLGHVFEGDLDLAVLQLERDFLQLAAAKGDDSGACLLLALCRRDSLVVSWCGDARAVLKRITGYERHLGLGIVEGREDLRRNGGRGESRRGRGGDGGSGESHGAHDEEGPAPAPVTSGRGAARA